MGQDERTGAVSGAFPESWSAMLASPDWWPAAPQVRCARLIREAGGVTAALGSDEFVDALGASLRQWKAFRGAAFDRGRLVASLRDVAPALRRWEGASILRQSRDDIRDLFEIFAAMRDVKPTTRKWVVVSKTLHHLLPDLVVPMDNLMTAPFLGTSSLPATFDASFLEVAYSAFTDLARSRTRGIGVRQVRTAGRAVPYPVPSSAKSDCRIGHARVVDFAIAGFVLRHGRSALRRL